MSRSRAHGPQLTFFAEVSRVRTSPAPASAEGSAGRGPASGTTSPASSGNSPLASLSSKTSPAERRRGSRRSVVTCEGSGIERAPWGLPPATWEPRTFGDASSLLPSPMASHPEGLRDRRGLQLLPTPSATPYGSNVGGAEGRKGEARLSLESMARKGILPTPCVSRETWSRDPDGGRKTRAGLGMVVGTEARLSPLFVEWMMGFPVDWTLVESEPSATRSSRSARKSSGS